MQNCVCLFIIPKLSQKRIIATAKQTRWITPGLAFTILIIKSKYKKEKKNGSTLEQMAKDYFNITMCICSANHCPFFWFFEWKKKNGQRHENTVVSQAKKYFRVIAYLDLFTFS